MQQAFTLNLHLPIEGLQQLQILLSLHKQAQVAIGLETLQVVRFQLEIFELLQQLSVIFKAVQRPGHLALDTLIQLFLLV